MKKHILILIYFLFFSSIIIAQTVVYQGINSPRDIVIDGDILYAIENGNLSIDPRIVKLNITDFNPNIETVIEGFNNPEGLVLLNNVLYVSDGDNTGRWISSIDLTETNLTLTTVVSGLNFNRSLTIIGNELYYTSLEGVSKIDLNDTNLEPIVVATNNINSPDGIESIGTDIYITQRGSNKIMKIDTTQDIPIIPELFIDNIPSPFGLNAIGDVLYVSTFFVDTIYEIVVTDSNPTFEMVIDGLDTPWGLTATEGELFYTEYTGSRIAKIDRSNLSTNEFEENDQFKIYPNPTEDLISLSDFTLPINYSIYDIYGKLISPEMPLNSSQINVSKLQSGVYFLYFKKGMVRKFIKK